MENETLETLIHYSEFDTLCNEIETEFDDLQLLAANTQQNADCWEVYQQLINIA